MSKRQVWVVEVSSRGEDDWRPMNEESFIVEEIAQRRLRDYAEPPRSTWEYRIASYTPEKP
jgi:hypothetical protein